VFSIISSGIVYRITDFRLQLIVSLGPFDVSLSSLLVEKIAFCRQENETSKGPHKKGEVNSPFFDIEYDFN